MVRRSRWITEKFYWWAIVVAPSITWNDGVSSHTAYLQNDQLAQITQLEQSRRVTLHAVPARNARALLERNSSLKAPSPISPVFADSQDRGGRLRTLPGHVIAHLHPELTTREIEKWALKHRFKVLQFLDFKPNVVLIESAPGLAVLDLTNQLRTLPEVQVAYPNWWVQTAKK